MRRKPCPLEVQRRIPRRIRLPRVRARVRPQVPAPRQPRARGQATATATATAAVRPKQQTKWCQQNAGATSFGCILDATRRVQDLHRVPRLVRASGNAARVKLGRDCRQRHCARANLGCDRNRFGWPRAQAEQCVSRPWEPCRSLSLKTGMYRSLPLDRRNACGRFVRMARRVTFFRFLTGQFSQSKERCLARGTCVHFFGRSLHDPEAGIPKVICCNHKLLKLADRLGWGAPARARS